MHHRASLTAAVLLVLSGCQAPEERQQPPPPQPGPQEAPPARPVPSRPAKALQLDEPTEQRVGSSRVLPTPDEPEASGIVPPDTPSAEKERKPEWFCFEGVPASRDPEHPVKLLPFPYFTVGYSEERRNPLWVCYRIGPITDYTTYGRKGFIVDKRTDARISHSMYDHSGFSRGHMAPKFAIGSRFGKKGNDATFVMSNVCPQYQLHNDRQWGDLEEWIAGRKTATTYTPGWADELEEVWVTVGPIFDEDRDPLPGGKGIEVPNAFFCIVIDVEGSQPRAIAFIMDHVDEAEKDLTQFLTSVDEIERRTGLDFFRELPDAAERRLEAKIESELWALN